MRDLAKKYNCLSLCDGASNQKPPKYLIKEMNNAIKAGHNQYGRVYGEMLLVHKLAEVYGKKLGHKIKPTTEIMCTQGANGAIASFINAFCNAGDEVVTFSPMSPFYLSHIEMSGAKIVEVPLKLNRGKWDFNQADLAKALKRSKVKVLLLNQPHTPTGFILSKN